MRVTISAPARLGGEIAPAQERNAHRVQITVTDASHVGGDEPWRDVRFRLQRYSFDAVSEVQRQAVRYGYGGNTTRLGEIVAGRFGFWKAGVLRWQTASSGSGAAYSRSESNPRSAVAVARTRSRQMPPITSNGTAIATCKAAVKRWMRPTRSPPPPASSFSEEMITGRLNRVAGKNPNTRLANEAEPETDCDHREIDSQRLLELSRNGFPIIHDSSRRDVEEHERSKSRPDDRQQDGFGEKIPDQAAAAGADRLADRQFAFSHRAANLHHAGDVQAHDEKHHARQREPDGLKQRELGSR